MTYSDARFKTEAELHTIEALLLLLDDAALTHLTNDQEPILSGIINLIQVIGDRTKRARELHGAEYECHRKEAGAATIGAAASAPKAKEVETPVMRLFQEWKEADAAFKAAKDDDAVSGPLHSARWQIETRLMDTPSQNMRDVLIKLNAWTYFGDGELEGRANPLLEMFWLDVRAFSGMAAKESAVSRLYREFTAHRAWIEAADLDEEQMNAATDHSEAILKRIVDARPESPADTAIKFFVVTMDYEALYGVPYREQLEAEARALIA